MPSSESTLETRRTALQVALDHEKARVAYGKPQTTAELIESARRLDEFLRTQPDG